MTPLALLLPPHPSPPPLVSELLIIGWGVCFMAALRDSTPTMRGRDFSKFLEEGKKAITARLRMNSSQASGPDAGESHRRSQRGTAPGTSTRASDGGASRGRAQVVSAGRDMLTPSCCTCCDLTEKCINSACIWLSVCIICGKLAFFMSRLLRSTILEDACSLCDAVLIAYIDKQR